MPENSATPAEDVVHGDRAKQIERTKLGLILLSFATLLSWIPIVQVLGLAVGAIAVVLVLIGASAFGSRHIQLAWTAVITFVVAEVILFGLIDSFATTITSLPSGASGHATASKVLAAFDTLLYGSLVVVLILSLCNALIAFRLEDFPGRIMLATGVVAQVAISVSLIAFVLIPLVHHAVEEAFATTPPDMTVIADADAQVRSLHGLAVLNGIPSVLFACAYIWAHHRISHGAALSPSKTAVGTSRALLAGLVGLIVLVSAAEAGALVSGILPITPRPPPAWRTAAVFSGNTTGTTENFTITGTQFQFSESVIDYGPGSFSFSFTLYHAGTSIAAGTCGFGGGAGPGSAGCGGFSGSGSYYLAVTDATGVGSWTITVTELV